MAAPPKNENAVRHGIDGAIRRGKRLPKGCRHQEREARRLTNVARQQCLDQKGEVTLTDAAILDEIWRHEVVGLLALKWLRNHIDEMDADQKMRFAKEFAQAATRRNQALKQLGLDVEQPDDDPWGHLPPDLLQQVPSDAATDDPDEDTGDGENASDAATEAEKGKANP